ncbi:MAG: (2Fe-2S)-binding protein [Syntrophobacteraceae bacterium]|jgi:xanthine dehydrogenase YagT iron-sulfur-binding subunit|nr:(2Fe-2S)-binding protein [Syntrophobacteraceae bacterium]
MKTENPKMPAPLSGRGITRRGFIKGVGTGAAAAAVSGALSTAGPAESALLDSNEMHRVVLKVNGRAHTQLVEPRWTLLFVLREKMGMTGTKPGCERGECGACTVLIDGLPRYACMTLAVEAQGSDITTIEGLMHGEDLGPVQKAFLENDAFQCGYCTPGQIVAAEGLLRSNPKPSLHEIQQGMSGNLCRCGAYVHIFQAVEDAAKARGGK